MIRIVYSHTRISLQVGRVLHNDMKGGLADGDGQSATLTSYILIALLEAGVNASVS